ncbi:nucleotidyltransferase family protein [Altibacter sp. HG106]|uniref:nucleotidyltransferase family protein n=1 Tax=Altibacter sp. HG106 TaxID=3023937 RepID=UPI00235000D4|nr:nucleotidyltransferase family protein [Altibacter sp. HG106]MDC7995338.1 nucleotidyltransferase family protein [Altibacter sp. HG106]
MNNIAVLLMAAGGSSRMGQPKPLLPWHQTTLIEHQLSVLQQLSDKVFVVLGAHSEGIVPVLSNYSVETVINATWKQGMGRSIALGVEKAVKTHPEIQGILIALVDQPLIGMEHFKQLLSEFKPDAQQIIVSKEREADWWGAPVLFDRHFFPELQTLSGDTGAKKLSMKYTHSLVLVPCDTSLEDMDTPEAYHRLKERASRQS